MSRIGIIAALGFEAGALGEHAAFLVRRCRVSGDGVGRDVRELADSGCRLVVSWGTAGALSPDLEAGDLFLADRVLTRDGEYIGTDPAWRRRLEAAVRGCCRVRSGLLLDSPTFVAVPARKSDLAQSCRAEAVDMESGAIAEACYGRDLPFLVVRAILDQAGDRLPDLINRHLGDDGRTRTGALLAALAVHPRDWTAFARLARRYPRARTTLARAASALAACVDDGGGH